MAGPSVRHRQGDAGDAQAVATALHPESLGHDRHASRHGRTSSCPGRIGRGLSLVQRGRVAHFILSRSSTMAWSKASTRIKPWRGYSSSRMTYTETAIAPAKPSAWAQLSVLALAMP